MKDKNPYEICTWDEDSKCSKCTASGKIHCKWSMKTLNGFLVIAFPPFLMTIFLTVVVGIAVHNWWWLIGYLVYVVFIFTWEIKFLCSHCPYYSEDCKTLHCLGNYGAYKFYKYNPASINKFERFMMLFLIVSVFFIFPFAATVYGITALCEIKYNLVSLLGIIGIGFGNIMMSGVFIVILKMYYCSKCINFSCVFNTVAKSEVDTYLKNNDVMRKAWEKDGYKLD